MKKNLLIMLFLIGNLVYVGKALADIDCTAQCRADAGVRGFCLQPVPAGNAPVYEQDITGYSVLKGFPLRTYCECKCGGYANGGIVREIEGSKAFRR